MSVEVHHRDVKCIAPPSDPGEGESAAVAAITPSKLRNQVAQAAAHSTGVAAAAKKMVDLRTNVLDALSLLETQNEDSMLRMQAVHRRVNDANEAALGQLTAFDEEFVYSNFVGFTIPRIIDEAKMGHDVEWLNSFGLPVTYPKKEEYDAYFKVLNEKLLDQPGDTTCDEIRSTVTRPLFPFGDKKIPEMLTNMNLFALTDVLGGTRAKLASVNNSIAELEERIRGVEEDMRCAQTEEDLATFDKKNGELLDLHSAKVELLGKKVKMLTTGDVKGGGLLSKLEVIVRSSAIPDLLKEKQELKRTTQRDIQLLEGDRIEKLKENEGTISKYNHWIGKSRNDLRNNHAQQHDAWLELEATLRRLGVLGEDAKGLMHRHMEATETEQKRRQEHREYLHCYGEHRQVLDDLVASCDVSADFLQRSSEFIAANKQKVESMQVEEKLQEMVRYEKRLFDAAYLNYGDEASQLIDRYDSRLIGLDNMVAELGFQKAQAFAVEDAEGNEYSKNSHNLEVSARQVRKKREKRQDQLDSLERLFMEIDAVVDDDDDIAASPAVRIRALQATKRDDALGKVAALHGEHANAADNTKHNKATLDEMISLDREAIVAKQEARKASPKKLQ